MPTLFRLAIVLLLGVSLPVVAHSYTQRDTVFNRTDAKGKQGHWKKVYANGVVAYRAQFVNDRPVGLLLRYNEQGILIARLRYDKKQPQLSRAELFDEKGRLMAKGRYWNKDKDSVWTMYTPKGGVVARESYNRGVKHGVWEKYSDEGVLMQRYNWQKGQQHGRQSVFFDTGKPRFQWEMRQGKAHGPTFSCTPTGVIVLKGEYRDDKREGDWISYSEKGKPLDTVRYLKGEVVYESNPINTDSLMRAMYRNAGRIAEPSVNDLPPHLR